LTGSTGFLGKLVLCELLRRREELGLDLVYVAIREKRGVSPEDRFRSEVVGSRCFSRLPEGWWERIRVVPADLASEGAGLEPKWRIALAERVTHVIHCAASVDFHLPVRQAAASNVTSALNVLDLAREMPSLQAMVDVSTAYVTPHRGDDVVIEERLAQIPGSAASIYDGILAGDYDASASEARLLAENHHPNTYTLTKCLSEHLLSERRGELPLVLVRPAIITASLHHPFPGWIDSPAAFALFAIAIGLGRMRAVIARPDARLDLVPVDLVAERVIDSAFRPPHEMSKPGPPPIRHAVVGYENCASAEQSGRTVADFFERNPLGDGRSPAAQLRYLGPDGLRYRIHHWLHHKRAAESREIADRLAETNRRFAYFTQNTFRFESSLPLDEPGWDTAAYLELLCSGIYRHLLGGDKTEVTLAGRCHRRGGGDLLWALRQPRGNPAIRLAAWLVTKVLRRAADRVTVDVDSFRCARAAAPPGAAHAITPSHRSLLDFVLVSYLCFARPDLGFEIPHVAAATEFGRIPVLGWLLTRMHAFYLERGRGQEDKHLTLHVHDLIRDGQTLEFFVEGRRSRSRRFLAPRRGLLRSLQATGRVASLFPVAISYDHIPEEAVLSEELRGAHPPPMRLRDLLAWTAGLLRGRVALGRIHLACGRPVILDLSTDVQTVGSRVMAELQQGMVTTTHHLRSFIARAAEEEIDLDWLCEAIARRGGRVIDVPNLEREVDSVVERCMREHFLHLFHSDALGLYVGNPAVEAYGRFNCWVSDSPRDVEASLRAPQLRATVRALYAPLCRDYARVALTAGRLLAEGAREVISAGDVLDAFSDAHLPDVEDALVDLCDREILMRVDPTGCYVRGLDWKEIESYSVLCDPCAT
jgi:thioester reductase-like protein